jgi:hypothetical protein
MAGMFTRLSDDYEAHRERTQRSTGHLPHSLEASRFYNCNSCLSSYGGVNGGGINTTFGRQIDADSVLRGFDRYATKSNSQNAPHSIQSFQLGKIPECSSRLESQYTRFTHPAYEIKGLTTCDMRMDYLNRDPQCHIFENFAVNTSLMAKDKHVPTWQEPQRHN